MTKKNELYKLIHSLTPNEKAYFKKFAYKTKSDTNKSYLLMFDVLLNQNEYDEEALKKKLKDTKLLNNFSAAKTYLADLIIKTFSSVQENNSIDDKILSIIQEFSFLLERRVNKMLEKKIHQAKKMILEFELYNYYLIVSKYEYQLLEVNKNYEINKQKLEAEYNEYQKKLNNIQKYQQLKDEWLIVRQDTNTYIREKSRVDFVSEKLSNPFLSDENNAETIASKILFYYVRVGYLLMINDVENAYLDSLKQYKILKNNSNYCRANEKEVIVTLSNFILRMLNIKEFEYFEEVKKMLFQFLDKSKDIELIQSKKLNIALVEKNQYLEKNQFTKIYNLLPIYFNAIEFYTKRKDIQLSMLYDMAVIYFYNDKFDDCLEYLSKVLNHKDLHTIIDLESYCLLLRMFVFVEIGQTHNFDANIENLRRKLYRDERMFKTENVILKMLLDYNSTSSSSNKTKIIFNYKNIIETILQDNLEQNIINYFPINLWINAKLEHKTIFQKFNKN